jgi:hypothetical protein
MQTNRHLQGYNNFTLGLTELDILAKKMSLLEPE